MSNNEKTAVGRWISQHPGTILWFIYFFQYFHCGLFSNSILFCKLWTLTTKWCYVIRSKLLETLKSESFVNIPYLTLEADWSSFDESWSWLSPHKIVHKKVQFLLNMRKKYNFTEKMFSFNKYRWKLQFLIF